MAHLGRVDEEVLFRRLRRYDDEGAREEIVRRHLPRATALARRFHRTSECPDDLEQVAAIGLLKAVDRFDPDAEAAFWTFATPTVLGELKRHLRDHCWTVRVPRPVQEASLAVQRAMAELTTELGRSPSTAEIAGRLGWGGEDVVEAIEAASAFSPDSLDAPLGTADGDGASVGETLGVVDEGYDAAERHVALTGAMRELDPRSVLILHLRFSEDLTQSEIAARVGISQMHVSRLIRRSLDTIRRSLERDRGAQVALVA